MANSFEMLKVKECMIYVDYLSMIHSKAIEKAKSLPVLLL